MELLAKGIVSVAADARVLPLLLFPVVEQEKRREKSESAVFAAMDPMQSSERKDGALSLDACFYFVCVLHEP